MKKYISAIMAAVLIITTGCSGNSTENNKQVELIVKLPPISMIAANDKDIDETEDFIIKAAQAFEEQYTDADVTVKVELFEYLNEDAAIVGAFDTDNAADVLYEGYFNMNTYIHSGRVVPLDDIISDDLRNDVDQSIWQMSMSMVNGKTYMMPFLSLQNVLMYNKELFRQCGLDEYINEDAAAIDSWSADEWEYVLDTLAQRLPEGCYPMMMYAKNNQGDTHIMTLIRSRGCEFFDNENMFNVETEEGVQALEWIRSGCDRGWYPPKCENLEISENTELFSNNQLAIITANNASGSNFDKGEYGCVNFPSVNGEGLATSFVTGFEVFDNGDEDKLAAAKAFVRFIMENEEWADYQTGGIPARNSISEKYKDDIYMLESFSKNNKNVVDFTRNNPNWRGVREVFYPHINDLLSGRKSAADAAAEIDADCNAAINAGIAESRLHE